MNRTLEEFKVRILTPRVSGLSMELVLADYDTGSTRMLNTLARETEKGEGVRVINASGVYGDHNFLSTLAMQADVPFAASAPTRATCAALTSLSDGGKRFLTIVIAEAQELRRAELARLILCMEEAATIKRVNVCLIPVLKKVDHYCRDKENEKAWVQIFDFPQLPALLSNRIKANRVMVSELRKEGVEIQSRAEARKSVEQLISKAS